MRIVCAWCQQPMDGLGPVSVVDTQRENISHGICVPCREREFAALPVTKTDEVKCCHGVPGNQFCVACEAEV